MLLVEQLLKIIFPQKLLNSSLFLTRKLDELSLELAAHFLLDKQSFDALKIRAFINKWFYSPSSSSEL
jgi:hypothetical protein